MLENEVLCRVCCKSFMRYNLELLILIFLVQFVTDNRKLELTFSVPWQGKMIMQDKLEKERNDAKNAVEEYVYEFRDKLCGPYEKFICEQVCLESGFIQL